MAQTFIRADGKSPLTCYVNLLVSVPYNLELRLYRDAEAVRILMATPALPEAIRRVERWYRDRQREKKTGCIVPTRRIWTRRDERRVNMLRGLPSDGDGCWPACRVALYLGRLEPRSGASLHNKYFRRAVDEARRDGTAAVLCPKLEQAKAIYERLISAARSVSKDNGGQSDFESARIELGILAGELMDWTKLPGPSRTTPAHLDVGDIQRQIAEEFQAAKAALAGRDITDATIEAGNAAQGDHEAEPTSKPATVHERMAGTIMENPEAMGWNSPTWAKYLKCGRSTVVETTAWKQFERAREQAKAERMKDRRRKPKASDRRQD